MKALGINMLGCQSVCQSYPNNFFTFTDFQKPCRTF